MNEVMGAFLHSDGTLTLMPVDPTLGGLLRLFNDYSFNYVYGQTWVAIVRPYQGADLYENPYAQFVFDVLEPVHRTQRVWGSAVFVGLKDGWTSTSPQGMDDAPG